MAECAGREVLERLLPPQGEQVHAVWALGQAITSTALAEGVTGEGLVRRLLETDLVAGALRDYPEYVAPLWEEIVAVLSDDACIAPLTAMLDDFYKRRWAAMILGWFGPKARSALPGLVDLASMSNASTGAAKKAVVLIGAAEEEITALRAAVDDLDDGSFRELSGLAIMVGYGSASWLAGILEAAAGSSNEDLREWVPVVIERMSPEARRRLKPVLVALRDDPVAAVREAAYEVRDE